MRHVMLPIVLWCCVAINTGVSQSVKTQVTLPLNDSTLAAFYPFTGNLSDSSGNGRNLTNFGAQLTTGIDGAPNSAYYFDNRANMKYQNPTDIAAKLFSPMVSVSIWFIAAADYTVFDVGPHIFNISGDWGDSEGHDITLYQDSIIIHLNVNNAGISCSYPFVRNTWYHTAYTYNGDSLKLYVNGIFRRGIRKPGQITYSQTYKTMGVGMWNAVSGYEHYFKGSLDNLRIYNRALSDTEIIRLFQEGSAVGISDLSGEFYRQQLTQNYPNPFNPLTTITYSVYSAGIVTLKVYNILGDELKTLVNEDQPAGKYTVHFNAANLPGGVYFYTLTSGKFGETKKLVLIK